MGVRVICSGNPGSNDADTSLIRKRGKVFHKFFHVLLPSLRANRVIDRYISGYGPATIYDLDSGPNSWVENEMVNVNGYPRPFFFTHGVKLQEVDNGLSYAYHSDSDSEYSYNQGTIVFAPLYKSIPSTFETMEERGLLVIVGCFVGAIGLFFLLYFCPFLISEGSIRSSIGCAVISMALFVGGIFLITKGVQ